MSDAQLPYTIQSIDMVKHNPNIFWVNPLKFGNLYALLGGDKFGVCSALGGLLSVGYFNASRVMVKMPFYQRVWHIWGRVMFGLMVGGIIGYQKFGDKQRMHNLYTADRIFRRYPDSQNITTTDLEQFRGHAPHEEYYKWA